MSAIWDNDEIKDKILLLSPDLQEAFLRAVDSLHNKESDFMLTFIRESRNELRDTHEEIEREQEILRDTSDLLASKRMYGDPDDWDDDNLEGNAVDEYLRRRNQGDVLGIINFEDERKARKKHKKRDKNRDKRSNSVSENRSRSAFTSISETDRKKEKKHKKDKHRDREPTSAWADEPSDSIILEKTEKDKEREKKHKKEKKKDKERRERSRSRDGLGMEREKTLDDIKEAAKDQTVIEKETHALMKDYISRETSNIEQKNQFEEAMMKKLAAKKNKRAAEVDTVMQQQIAAEKAISDAKADFEAKMMEKLRAKREASGLSQPSTNLGLESEMIVENEVDGTKKKKEKKKKKHKNKDKHEEGEDNGDNGEKKQKKEKKKKKKKDRDREIEIEDI